MCKEDESIAGLDARSEDKLLHHTQKKMKRRINLLLEVIESSRSEGMMEEKLEEMMLINGVAEPALTRKYLKHLEGFGKVVEEDGRIYSANFHTNKTVQSSLDREVVTHTSHTHEEKRD